MSEPITGATVAALLASGRFDLSNEYAAQRDIDRLFAQAWGPMLRTPWWAREWRMSAADRPDFAIEGAAGFVLVEVKHKRAQVPATLAQLTRYADDDRVAEIVLATGRAMSVPATLGDRAVPVHVVNLARGWL